MAELPTSFEKKPPAQMRPWTSFFSAKATAQLPAPPMLIDDVDYRRILA